MTKKELNIHSLIRKRWSPRAMSGEELSEDEFLPLFEAARWAPSSYNAQPWRFLITKRGTNSFDKLFSTLVEANQVWTKNASLLVLFLSRTRFERNDKPSITHSFDAGAAWENLALEGSHRHLAVHGMQGFDYEKARSLFAIPELYDIEMMIAIGKHGDKKNLPENLQKVESPKERKALDEIISLDQFKFL